MSSSGKPDKRSKVIAVAVYLLLEPLGGTYRGPVGHGIA